MHRPSDYRHYGVQTFWDPSLNLPEKILQKIPLRGIVFHAHRVGFDSRDDTLGG